MKWQHWLLIVGLVFLLPSPTQAQRRNARETSFLQSFMNEDYDAAIKSIDVIIKENPDHPKLVNLVSMKARSMYLSGKDRAKSFATFKEILEIDGRFKGQVLAGAAKFFSNFEKPLTIEEWKFAFRAAKESGNARSLYDIVDRAKTDAKSITDKGIATFLKKKLTENKDLKAPSTPMRSPFSTGAKKVTNPINIGDKLPNIGDRATWIKGEAVKKFQPGKIYVIDLWATWCGPCVAAMPHVSKISKKYQEKNVVVIGLAFDPKSATPTDEFVEKNQKKIHYRICEDIDGKLHHDYFRRINLAGIPTILIVNKKGRLAWLGHPNNMDTPLQEIVDGTYDLKKAKKMFQDFASEKPAGNRGGRGGKRPKIAGGRAQQMIQTLFEKGDKDKDGFLTDQELNSTFADNGRLLLDPRRLKGLDKNKDGKYSKEEIKALLNRRRGR